MPSHLEKARNNWDAVLTVPKEIRGVSGLPSLRFRKSTGTPDKRKAYVIASQLVAGWVLQIEQAKGNDVGFLADAIKFREDLEKAQDDECRETLESVLIDHVERIEQTQGLSNAKQFYGVAKGTKTPSTLYFDEWKAQLTVTPRTIEQYSKDAKLFIEQFNVVEDVSKKDVSTWLVGLSGKAVTKNTQKRILKGCRSYWAYLITRDVVEVTRADPFHKVLTVDKGKKKKAREPFKPHEIIELWRRAKDSKEDVLADLIVLGAYTGARIEELCNLKVKDVAEDVFNIIDSKTLAGVRAVPIHSHIKVVFKRLKDDAKDAYLLPSLALDKFGDRSNTMSSRFSKLKIKAGYSGNKVFHSLRHALITSLSNAGVIAFHIADIVGHEKRGVTGEYAQATNIKVKRRAIEKVSYPFPELT